MRISGCVRLLLRDQEPGGTNQWLAQDRISGCRQRHNRWIEDPISRCWLHPRSCRLPACSLDHNRRYWRLLSGWRVYLRMRQRPSAPEPRTSTHLLVGFAQWSHFCNETSDCRMCCSKVWAPKVSRMRCSIVCDEYTHFFTFSMFRFWATNLFTWWSNNC